MKYLIICSFVFFCSPSYASDNRNIAAVMAQAKKIPDVNRGKRIVIAPYPRTPIKQYPRVDHMKVLGLKPKPIKGRD